MKELPTKRILILGGDGFCGWPVALDQSERGNTVKIIDNLSRRTIDNELGTNSLIPIATTNDRLVTWEALTNHRIDFDEFDIASDYTRLKLMLAEFQPDVVIHFAEQRSAPYSSMSAAHRNYTVQNNISATHNLLVALTEVASSAHLVHLGSVGVYGYSSRPWKMPEGYLSVTVPSASGPNKTQEILHPFEPVSVYHLTKCLDSQMFEFYSRNDHLMITDLHQGIVWGTQTEHTLRHLSLANRFDYDAIYGTVVNRFLIQAASGSPLTVYGSGMQTRAFIHLTDAVTCVNMAIENPPAPGSRPMVRNQVAECRTINEVAQIVGKTAQARVEHVSNPRTESPENVLNVSNDSLVGLGLTPTLLSSESIGGDLQIARQYQGRSNAAFMQPQKV